jgi:ActR/RegA family two-component response regulator
MVATTSTAPDEAATAVTPWVLIVASDEAKALSARTAWEEVGFEVEVASTIEDALACLEVIIPALIVVGDRQYRPTPP